MKYTAHYGNYPKIGCTEPSLVPRPLPRVGRGLGTRLCPTIVFFLLFELNKKIHKLSSVRALHASLGVGLLVMHAHALLCIPELLGAGCYLRLMLHGCSPLEQQQLPILPGIFPILDGAS